MEELMASKNPKKGLGLGDVTPTRLRVLDELAAAATVSPVKVSVSQRPPR
jgi:hypothetical protein